MKQVLKSTIQRIGGETLMVRSLERQMIPRLKALAASMPDGATVIDIGAKNALYREIFHRQTFKTLDIEAKYGPDIVGDAAEVDQIIDHDSIDLVICTEVLEHVRHPQRVVDAIYAILKPGGVLLASTPFIISYHPDPTDY